MLAGSHRVAREIQPRSRRLDDVLLVDLGLRSVDLFPPGRCQPARLVAKILTLRPRIRKNAPGGQRHH